MAAISCGGCSPLGVYQGSTFGHNSGKSRASVAFASRWHSQQADSPQHRGRLGRPATKASRARNDHRALASALGRSQAAGEKALSAHLADGAAELHRLRKHLRT
jgi:hypothetical protein